jgi:hypothetical protein
MIRSISYRPLLFAVLAWACIVAMGADFANLDDLLTTGVVLHDDQDVLSDVQNTHARADNAYAPVVAHPLHPVACAIIDQDSPSPAPDTDASVLPFGQVFLEPSPFALCAPPAGEALYIKHQSLLI